MNRRDFTAVTLGSVALPAAEAAQAVPAGFELRLAQDRGVAEHGWLSSRHSFSFARYYDPAQVGFSDLFVINEDKVKPGRGFGTHPHRNVEIFTYVLEGALEHKDSMGNGTVIRPGDVQFLSAGRGITHSEYNPSASEDVHFLQIWLAANQAGTEPTYQQKSIEPAQMDGRLALVIDGKPGTSAIHVKQNARVFAGRLNDKQTIEYTVPFNRHTYVHVARGTLELNGVVLRAGDGVKVRAGAPKLSLSKGAQAEVLLFDLRTQGYAEGVS